MSYVKQNFVDGQTLTAAQLNHMEAGIANAAGTQGEKGDKGEKGDPGPAGAKGDPGEGFTANAKALLLNLFENAAYKTDTMQLLQRRIDNDYVVTTIYVWSESWLVLTTKQLSNL
mgnify:CR=1 FL=1